MTWARSPSTKKPPPTSSTHEASSHECCLDLVGRGVEDCGRWTLAERGHLNTDLYLHLWPPFWCQKRDTIYCAASGGGVGGAEGLCVCVCACVCVRVRACVRACVLVWNCVCEHALAQSVLTVRACLRACEGFNCGFPFYSVHAFFLFFWHWSNVLIVVICF